MQCFKKYVLKRCVNTHQMSDFEVHSNILSVVSSGVWIAWRTWKRVLNMFYLFSSMMCVGWRLVARGLNTERKGFNNCLIGVIPPFFTVGNITLKLLNASSCTWEQENPSDEGEVGLLVLTGMRWLKDGAVSAKIRFAALVSLQSPGCEDLWSLKNTF